ncbi:MAG: hypothetical protein AAF432_12035 [Planctomycetota bacterium]
MSRPTTSTFRVLQLGAVTTAAMLLVGCTWPLNERAGLVTNDDLPALDVDSTTAIASAPSVNGHDRSHWSDTTITIARDNVTHHPTFVGQPSPAFSTIESDHRFPTAEIALQPESPSLHPSLDGLRGAGLFLIDVVAAPVRMIAGTAPQKPVRSPGGPYQRTPDDMNEGFEEAFLPSPFQPTLRRIDAEQRIEAEVGNVDTAPASQVDMAPASTPDDPSLDKSPFETTPE